MKLITNPLKSIIRIFDSSPPEEPQSPPQPEEAEETHHTVFTAPTALAITVTLEEAYTGIARVISLPDGRRINLAIPPGIRHGQRIRVTTEQPHLVTVRIQPHARYTRRGDDLHTTIKLPIHQALLGHSAQLATPAGPTVVHIPPRATDGQRVNVPNRGMPKIDNPDQHGALIVTVRHQQAG